jgi:Protein of unknown function (DUF1579)
MNEEKQFDFLKDEWDAFCRFPQEDGTWSEGKGTLKASKILRGYVSLELYNGPLYGEMIEGIGLRAYNRETKMWEHTWTDTSTPAYFYVWRGVFKDGKIDLFSEWIDNSGNKVKSRLTWSEITDQSAHWESSRSLDEGRTWKKYWIIDFKKRIQS